MKSWLSKLGDNFKNTSSSIKNVISRKRFTQEDLNNLEEALIKSDLGVIQTETIINNLRNVKSSGETINNSLFKLLISKFEGLDQELRFNANLSPQVILFVGVNGSGKTTTLVKLANQIKKENLEVTVAAGDTFRAAAREQLIKWSNKINFDLITGDYMEDPSSVIFKSYEIAKNKGPGVLLLDTAGRLHTKLELMDELKKIVRTLSKHNSAAPHNKILVLDSTIGQNTYAQLEEFDKQIGITGLIMTKLDGSGKGGALIGIAEKFKKPIHAIGIGEDKDDLINFNPNDFVKALIGKDERKNQ